jgi:hypothetical protein
VLFRSPRAWTLYFAEMAGVKVADELPASWVERVERDAGTAMPATFSEPAVTPSYDVDPAVDHSVEEVRDLVFPRHGLA